MLLYGYCNSALEKMWVVESREERSWERGWVIFWLAVISSRIREQDRKLLPASGINRVAKFLCSKRKHQRNVFCFQLERVTCLINRLEVPVPVPVRPKTSKPPNPLLVLKTTVVLVLQSPMIKTENVSSRISVIACIRVPVQMVILLYCHNS